MNLPKFLGCIFLCMLAGFLGSYFTVASEGSWYSELIKPDFQPPAWVFGPVWTALYILMGISFYLLLENREPIYARPAIYLFLVQLFLNFLWSFLFFGLQSPFHALVEIILLWIAIAATMLYTYRVSPKAALLLLPYILWVSFAAFLNYSIYVLNP